MKDGILLIDKPAGVTSHDIVEIARKKLKIKKVGHSGTLDPVATGILVLLVGKDTKLFSKFVYFDKEYEATLHLGVVTSTGDSQGRILSQRDPSSLGEDEIRGTFMQFIGERDQIPPMVSAIKYHGKRLYELARQGIEVNRKARRIRIYDLQISRLCLPEIDFYVKCTKGTYIRRLGEEIGEKLGVGGFISRIRRISLGPFHVREAIRIEDIDESHLRPWQA